MRPLVLLVDDSEDNRVTYGEYLVLSGYRVAVAADGQEAVTQARALLPDIVIMDLSLPVMDGCAATRAIKRDELTRGIPVVALTGHVLASQTSDARDAGCAEVLIKPCLPTALLATLRDVLARTLP